MIPPGPTPSLHDCIVPGCKRATRFLMCRRCWDIVPPFLRRQVKAAARKPEGDRRREKTIGEAKQVVVRHLVRLQREAEGVIQ